MEYKYVFIGSIIRGFIDGGVITDPDKLFDIIDSIRRMKDWEVRGLIHAEKTR